MVINLEKIWLHTEQQKCVAQDMVRDLEAMGLELESYLDGQVCPSICYSFVCV